MGEEKAARCFDIPQKVFVFSQRPFVHRWPIDPVPAQYFLQIPNEYISGSRPVFHRRPTHQQHLDIMLADERRTPGTGHIYRRIERVLLVVANLFKITDQLFFHGG